MYSVTTCVVITKEVETAADGELPVWLAVTAEASLSSAATDAPLVALACSVVVGTATVLV